MATKTLILRPVSSTDYSGKATEDYLNVNEEIADDDATIFNFNGLGTYFYFNNLDFFNIQKLSDIRILATKFKLKIKTTDVNIVLSMRTNLSVLFEEKQLKNVDTWEYIELNCDNFDVYSLITENTYIYINVKSSIKNETISTTQIYLEIDYEEIDKTEKTIDNLYITFNNIYKKKNDVYFIVDNVYKKVENMFLTLNGMHKLCYGKMGITPLDEDLILKLIDFDYIDNYDGTVTIINWKETLNGIPSTELIIPDDKRIIL